MAKKKQLTVLITGADHVTGLITARALKSRKIRIIGLANNLKSRYCRSNIWDQIETIKSENADILKQLINIGKIYAANQIVLMPTQDFLVQLVSDHRDELGKYYQFVLPSKESVELLINKVAFHTWAKEKGFPVPETCIASSQAELNLILAKIKYPILIKPLVRTPQWDKLSPIDKVLKLRNKEDINNVSFDLFQASPQYLVQKWIVGGDSNVYFCLMYINREGRELAYYTGQKLLQWPLGTGSTSICIGGAPNRIVYELTRDVLQAAKLRGLGSLEVKLCKEENKYYITEPTVGRNDLQSYIAVSGGVNLTKIAFYGAIQHDYKNECNKQKAMWIEEYSTFQAIKTYGLKGNIKYKEILKNLTCNMSFATFSLKDLVPFIQLIKEIVFKKIKRLFLVR